MRDLSAFEDERFDLIVHPCSNCFVEEIRPVWREAFRVLRRGGALLAGFAQPIVFCFDPELMDRGTLVVKYRVPYSDLESLTDEERRRYTDKGEPLAFGHSLDDQIGGQLDAGFILTGFYEDLGVPGDAFAEYAPGYMATRAIKPIQI
jgi:SAM-dependent methyltransferase